jgi:hypothetical protein
MLVVPSLLGLCHPWGGLPVIYPFLLKELGYPLVVFALGYDEVHVMGFVFSTHAITLSSMALKYIKVTVT